MALTPPSCFYTLMISSSRLPRLTWFLASCLFFPPSLPWRIWVTYLIFLGISITRDHLGLFLSQRQYVLDLLNRAHMSSCNPCRTPTDTQSKLDHTSTSFQDPTLYLALRVGSSTWLSLVHILYLLFNIFFSQCMTPTSHTFMRPSVF